MFMLPVSTNKSIKVTVEIWNCIQTRIGQCNHYSSATVRIKKKISSVKLSNRDHPHKCLVLEVQ